MSPEEKTLLDRGAECVGGQLILKRKVVGEYRFDTFMITPEGAAEAAIQDVEFVEVPVTKPAKARTKADADADARAQLPSQ